MTLAGLACEIEFVLATSWHRTQWRSLTLKFRFGEARSEMPPEQARRGIWAAVAFSAKLSPLYSSGLEALFLSLGSSLLCYY